MHEGHQSFTALIVGGGPAGTSCALWLKKLGYSPVIIERSGSLGGLQKSSPYINSWLLGQPGITGEEFAAKVHAQIQSLEIPVFFDTIPQCFERQHGGLWKVQLENSQVRKELKANFLVIATGVKPRTCGFTANHSVLIGPGKTIEEYNFTGKRVAILGGGDNAFENFFFIRDKGAKDVRIFARNVRTRNSFLREVPAGVFSVGSYFANQETMRVNREAFDTFVVLCGWEPVNPLNGQIPLLKDERGFISTDDRRRTSNSSVYAIGEVTCKSHPCVTTSMADGVICAKDIQQRIEQFHDRVEISVAPHAGVSVLV